MGGGVAHGPKGIENYRKSLNQKMRRKALFVTLSQRLRQTLVTVVDRLPAKVKKTKELNTLVSRLADEKKALLVVNEPAVFVSRAARNLPAVTVRLVSQLNALEVLGHQHVVITRDAVRGLERYFVSKSQAQNRHPKQILSTKLEIQKVCDFGY